MFMNASLDRSINIRNSSWGLPCVHFRQASISTSQLRPTRK